uniref:Lipoprotein n=1 Tax=Parastrongyloides trichosuri TaxID=131310 RepID=A0A0N4ZZG1_PARTI
MISQIIYIFISFLFSFISCARKLDKPNIHKGKGVISNEKKTGCKYLPPVNGPSLNLGSDASSTASVQGIKRTSSKKKGRAEGGNKSSMGNIREKRPSTANNELKNAMKQCVKDNEDPNKANQEKASGNDTPDSKKNKEEESKNNKESEPSTFKKILGDAGPNILQGPVTIKEQEFKSNYVK